MTESPASQAAHHNPDVALDQQLALKAAASRLQDEFGNQIGMDTIETFLQSSFSHFMAQARIPNFVPLLAERFTRQQLQALARIESTDADGKPTVLFLCPHNAGRSQMALGHFTHLAGEQALAWSGGSEPDTEINPAAVQAMADIGIDISGEYPKPFTDEIVQAADLVITMGCSDACPVVPGKRYEDWDLPDPAGQSAETAAELRDEIEQRVRRLLAELDVAVKE
jgi:arsenate reductase (thioredoxin)